ncbi:hypothetical protein [Natrinema longum]|uniref:hypothetical protein n=1 Tax=Natrinema longum TaxID=370324 RepID=UPI001CC99802|nr:hypothetical protein [Natrinema longum]MBZ6494646.1 hypothetical protein [Natrinema longum]
MSALWLTASLGRADRRGGLAEHAEDRNVRVESDERQEYSADGGDQRDRIDDR